MSLVFYKNTSPNNWFCEPNRLYQNLINGNPVVVGNNPPMKELIEQYEVGVCAETDGADVNAMVSAIKNLLDNYDLIKGRVKDRYNKWLWDEQVSLIKEITEKFLSIV